MTTALDELLGYIRSLDHLYQTQMKLNNKDWVYANQYDYLLREGRSFSPAEVLTELRGEPKLCFSNALVACNLDLELFYVEGLATGPSGFSVDHAWVTRLDEFPALEVTWDTAPGVYFGVIYEPDWVAEVVLQHDTAGAMADDFGEKKIPILRDGLPDDAKVEL